MFVTLITFFKIFKTLNDRQSTLLAESLRYFLDKSGKRKGEKRKEEKGKRKEERGKRKEERGRRKKVLSVTKLVSFSEPSVNQTLNLRSTNYFRIA